MVLLIAKIAIFAVLSGVAAVALFLWFFGMDIHIDGFR
jgi:hypothetical protein